MNVLKLEVLCWTDEDLDNDKLGLLENTDATPENSEVQEFSFYGVEFVTGRYRSDKRLSVIKTPSGDFVVNMKLVDLDRLISDYMEMRSRVFL